MRTIIKTLFLVSLVTLFVGCSSKQDVMNQSRTTIKPPQFKMKYPHQLDDTLLVLTFSGGGTRAAAFSYGVMKGLKNTSVNNSTLLSKVDMISSVSGGSFTSAYYGLYGEKIFEDFESKFLKKKIQSVLTNILINPFNWFSLFRRSDLAAEYYKEEIFGEKTFKDIREDSPRIVINATDLSTGNAFSFTPENFNRICSDISKYPIVNAVTASSAVPVLFSPVTLKNYDTCEHKKHFINGNSKMSHNDWQSLKILKYHEKERYPYLHLVDGGISDNLGVRPLMQELAAHDNNIIRMLNQAGLQHVNNVIFIVVNAADSLSPEIAKTEDTPAISDAMNAVSTIQLTRYNTDTLDFVQSSFNDWEKQINTYRCSTPDIPCTKMQFHLIELNFRQLPQKQAKRFSLIKTSLELPDEQVDELIEAGEKLLLSSKKFKSLVQELTKNSID